MGIAGSNIAPALSKLPFASGRMLEAHLTDSPKTIAVGTYTGYLVVSQDAPATIHRQGRTDLTLAASVPCNVTLWVF